MQRIMRGTEMLSSIPWYFLVTEKRARPVNPPLTAFSLIDKRNSLSIHTENHGRFTAE
jgi:hypothetical protein